MDTMPFIVLRTVAYVTAPTHTGTTGYVIAGSVFLLEGIATMRYRRIRKRREKGGTTGTRPSTGRDPRYPAGAGAAGG